MIHEHAALSVAGSDPSGGAGIQADLKTFTALGVYGAAAITCLTAQNTHGIVALEPVSAEFVREQVAAVLADLPVSHIKTGMIGTGAVARSLGELLAVFQGEIICDPVLTASDGKPLLEADGLADFLQHIAAHATVLTPNIPELSALSGCPVKSAPDIAPAVQVLFARFKKLRLILVTGGHLDVHSTTISDFLFQRNTPVFSLDHPRYDSSNTHGTGCTFAAAFTAHHLLTHDDTLSFKKTLAYMDTLLEASCSRPMGKGCGPLPHHHQSCRSD